MTHRQGVSIVRLRPEVIATFGFLDCLRRVRFVRTLLAGLIAFAVLIGGLLMAAVVALASLVVIVVGRLFGRTDVRRTSVRGRHPPRAAAAGNVIDVEATEVPERR